MKTKKEIFKQFVERELKGVEHTEVQAVFLGHLAFDFLESIFDFYTKSEMEIAKQRSKSAYLNRNKRKRYFVVDPEIMDIVVKNEAKSSIFINWLNDQSKEDLQKYIDL